MKIRYVNFSVGLHGLDLDGLEDLEKLRLEIDRVVRRAHPLGGENIFDTDVDVEVNEYAGMHLNQK